MSTIRKNPPQPAPSRIAGTLKLRKPAVETEVPAEADAEAAEKRSGGPARKQAGEMAGRARGTTDGGRERTRPADAPRADTRPPRNRKTGEVRETSAPRPRRQGEGAERTARAGEGERGAARRERTGAAGMRDERAPRARGAAPTDRTRAAAPETPRRGAPPAAARRADAPVRPAAAPHRAQAEAPTGVRLSKVMADRGICSRREADELIERGWVFVDGKRVSELGTRIDPDARVVLAPEAKRAQAQRVTILLHKPVGYVSGQPEPGYEPAVVLIGGDTQFDRDTAQRFHPSQLKGLAPAGRLDIDSTGLLVFTQDGRIARQLIGDDSKVEKEYLVRVEGRLIEGGLALLKHGLSLDDKPLRPAQVEWINDDQLRFVLKEGRKRQIRRMCELVGLKVVGLKRVRVGRVRLGDLPLGQWRYLREDEAF